MKTLFSLALVCLFYTSLQSQSFINPDLDGTIASNTAPTGWQQIPFTDPNSNAISLAASESDITGTSGPNTPIGVNGTPYSGNTFVSGIHSRDYCEGIMQTVNGFNIDQRYTINFYQAVVKQTAHFDTSGSWAVYIDNTLAGVTTPTSSQAPSKSNNFTWEASCISFTATSNTHTIKFLPQDDDNSLFSSSSLNGKLRMGIDSIHITRVNLGNDTAICPNQLFTLDASFPNTAFPTATYLWQDGSTSSTLNVTQPGTYGVEVTNGSCSVTDSIIVSQKPLLSVDLGNNITLCNGQNTLLDATSPNATYLWSDGSTNSTLTINSAGTYSVDVTNECGTSSDEIIISYTPSPIVNLGNDTTLCPNESLMLDANTPNCTYSWQNGSTNPTYNITLSGTYWTDVTNQTGCITRDSIVVDFNTPPTISLGKDTTLCDGENLLVDATFPSSSYLWSDGSTDSTLNISKQGNYSVDVTNICGTSSDDILISYNAIPSIELGNDTLLCNSESILLNAAFPNATYNWQDGSIDSTLTVNQAGTYQVTVVNGRCIFTDSIDISQNNSPIVNLGKDTVLCDGENLLLNVFSPEATYLWQDNSTLSTYNIIQPDTFIWVAVSNNCGIALDSIHVCYKSVPLVSIGNDTVLCTGEHVLLNASLPDATYLWLDGSTDSTFNVTQQGTYSVEVTNNCGTSKGRINFIDGNCGLCPVFLPNSFTPDGDGYNDYFFPEFNCEMIRYEFFIFNRWGELVFKAENINTKWNGSHKGFLAKPGVYAYRLEYVTNAFESKKITGHVNLLK